jgi:hypothetical protein
METGLIGKCLFIACCRGREKAPRVIDPDE